MYVSWHVALTTPPAAALAAIDPLGGALAFAGGVLIDSDHWLDFAWFHRSWSLRRAYWWHRRATPKWILADPDACFLCLFHSVEAMAAAALVGWLWAPGLWLLAGMLYHLLLDKMNDAYWKVFWKRAFFVVQWVLWARRRGWKDLVPPEEPLPRTAVSADIVDGGRRAPVLAAPSESTR